MSLITDSVCNFCNQQLEKIYTTTGTKRGMEVCVCSNCSLVQSLQTRKKPDEHIQTLSCDADWGNVRHGKGLRLEYFKNFVNVYVELSRINQVLDVGSNRGNFSLWLKENNPHIHITAIEPDDSIVDEYRSLSEIQLITERFENVELKREDYDFVYCSHTLEHAPSASGMLQQIHDAMKDGSVLFLEVPNLEGIGDPNSVEEFFMDKHTFHFDRKTLCNYCESIGFEIISGKDSIDSLNLSLFLRKGGDISTFPSENASSVISNNSKLLAEYEKLLPANRELLKAMVQTKLKPLAERQKVAYWGAGRLFDALMKYGGLKQDNVYCLVDKHLWKIIDKTHDIPIQRPEQLRILEPHIVVVLARSSAGTIARNANRMGVRHVLCFNELMDQCRIGLS